MLSKLREFLHDMQPYTVEVVVHNDKVGILRDSVSGIIHVKVLHDEGMQYINLSTLKGWCREQGVDVSHLIDGMKIKPYRLDLTSTRNVRCLVIPLELQPNYKWRVIYNRDGTLTVRHEDPECEDTLHIMLNTDKQIVVQALR
jgi:hypothetical protein